MEQQVLSQVNLRLCKPVQERNLGIVLHFEMCNINDQLLTKIADKITKTNIIVNHFEINLRNNNIGDKGAQKLFEVLQAKHKGGLQFHINLIENHIADAGAKAAAKFYTYVTENNGKASMYVSENCIGSEGCKALSKVNKNEDIQYDRQKPSSKSEYNKKLSEEFKEELKEKKINKEIKEELKEKNKEFGEEEINKEVSKKVSEQVIKKNDYDSAFKTLHIINEGLYITGTMVHTYEAYKDANTKNTVQATVDIVQSVNIVLKHSGIISESLGNNVIWFTGAIKGAYDIYSGNYWDAFSRFITTVTLAPILKHMPKEMQLGLIGGFTVIHALSVGSDMYHIYEEYAQSNKTHEQLDMVGQLPVDDHIAHDEI